MATYVIGDIQGCYEPLMRLLDRIAFDPASDRLWSCGDLVNRGPQSLEVLRWARGLGDSLVAVMGNHDLHLLARAEGLRGGRADDTMEEVLSAPDRDELIDWLASLPFLHIEEPWLLVHAGLLPQWSFEDAIALAGEATAALREDRRGFLGEVYGGPPPERWSSSLSGAERTRAIVAGLVRVRMVRRDGSMDPDFTGAPSEGAPDLEPWFDARRPAPGTTIAFGHWAALGLVVRPDIVALDTGCVWGNTLTAFRLEDKAVFQVPAR